MVVVLEVEEGRNGGEEEEEQNKAEEGVEALNGEAAALTTFLRT